MLECDGSWSCCALRRCERPARSRAVLGGGAALGGRGRHLRRWSVSCRPTARGSGWTSCRSPTPKLGPNRLHLDLTTTSLDDQRDSVARLVELGGRHIDIGQSPDDEHVVLADPEGNELCVIEPSNSFLADCGRLGAINCDGTREVGYFWSAALDWPLVWDQDEETAIRAPDGTGPIITWGGPPVAPKLGKNRWHLDVAPLDEADQHAEVDRLVALGRDPDRHRPGRRRLGRHGRSRRQRVLRPASRVGSELDAVAVGIADVQATTDPTRTEEVGRTHLDLERA